MTVSSAVRRERGGGRREGEREGGRENKMQQSG